MEIACFSGKFLISCTIANVKTERIWYDPEGHILCSHICDVEPRFVKVRIVKICFQNQF